jgi:hypothetical protein
MQNAYFSFGRGVSLLRRLGVAIALGCLLASPAQSAEPSRSKIKRFVQQIALAPEFGSKKNVVSRWAKAPSISVFGATPAEKAVVEEVVGMINPSLKSTIGEIRVLPDNDPSAELKVFFAPLAEFPRIAKENNVQFVAGNLGLFWTNWDEGNVIQSGIVMLASDRLTGSQLKHVVLEEIVQSLGLSNDSDEFPDSIFFARGTDGGSATRPSALDLQILQWFYQNASPGDSRKALSEKFDATWPK